MKKFTTAYLSTTELTGNQGVKNAMPYLKIYHQFKAMLTGALLLLLSVSATNSYGLVVVTPHAGALAAGTLPAAGSTAICAGASSQVVYSFKFTESGSADVLNTFSFTTSGTATAADITSFTVQWNTTPTLPATGVNVFGTVSTSTGAGTHSIAGAPTKNLTAAAWYFFITANLAPGATIGNTITVATITNATAPTNFTFTTAGETYTGTAAAAITQTIASGPTLSSAAAICPGATTTLTGSPTGGTWASSLTTVASVTGGVVTGVGAAGGTATITYTGTNGCPATVTETVNPGPTPVVVTPSTSYIVCPGGSVTATAASSAPTPTVLVSQNFNTSMTGQVGGIWTVDNTGTSSSFYTPYLWNVVASNSYAGAAGDGSSYAGCYPDPEDYEMISKLISPSFSTVGFTSANLTFNMYAEFDYSTDPNTEIDYSIDGGTTWSILQNYYVSGFFGTVGTPTWTVGTPNFTYALPAAALGQANVKLRWYYQSFFGYWWIVDNVVVSALPSILPASAFTWAGPTGVSCSSGCYSSTLSPTVGGVNVYTASATYLTCTAHTQVSVNVFVPQAILTNSPVCVGSATTTLTDILSGGTWSSGDIGVATIGAGTGVVSGVSPGVATITYTVPPGCPITAQATVNPLPNVSGFSTPSATNPCVGSGSVVSVNASTLGTATYTVQYSLSGLNTGTGTATLATSSGIGTFTTSALSNPGATTVTITSISNLFGCSTPVTSGNTASFTVNAPPSGILGTATVCAGQSTALSDATSGGTWSSGNTTLATVDGLGNVTGVAGGAPVISYTISSGCAATRAVTVNAAPPITGISSMCAGQTTTLTDATTGGTWNSGNGSVATIDPALGTVTSVSVGTTTISYTAPGTGCTATLPFSVTNTPGLFTVTGGGTFCVGGTGVHIGLTGSNPGVSYQLFIGAVAVGSPVTGTGGILDLGSQTTTGTYTVTANPGTACATSMVGSATISTNPLPTSTYTVGGGGSFCAGGIGYHITLSNSDFGYTYQLLNGSLPVGSPISGVSGVLTFPLQTTSGTYTVVGINGTTGCNVNMTGSATITAYPAPSPYIVTGGGAFCAGGTGVLVGLANSDVGTSYTLLNSGATVYSTTGTGTALNFGLQNIGGTYTVTAATTHGCTATMTGSASVIVNPLPTLNNVTGGGNYCTGATGVHIGLNGSIVGVNYQLINGGNIGTPMTGTSLSLDFGLQTAPGTYTVVASNATTGCSSTMAGSATVTVNPLPISTYNVTGGGTFCTGGTGFPIGLNGSSTGINYQLLNGATPTGMVVAGTGSAIPFGTITGAGTYSVLATNATTGCTSIMTGTASIIVNTPPPPFSVLGGGNYCIGGTGVNVVLNGSTNTVKYQLYNGVATVGGLVTGTGAALNFGLQTAAGSYNVIGTDTITGCSSNMTGSATVIINPLPNVYALTGGGGYCPGGTGVHVGLSGSDLSVNYQLVIGGTASGIYAGTGAPLDFGLETATVNYTATAVNTTTGCTNTMTGFSSVSINPIPPAQLISSTGNSYCSGGTGIVIGLTGSNLNINYQLYLGGSPVGAPVPGTGTGSITFGNQTGAGNYTVTGTNTITGCVNNMTGVATVSVNPLPATYTVTGGGNYCPGSAGVNIGLSGSATGINYQLYNGIPIGSPIGGNGAAINFGLETTVGTYTIVANNPVTSCTVNMFSSAVVGMNSLPPVQAISGGGSYCAGTAGRVVGMAGSNIGVNYQLYQGVSLVGAPVPGTGGAFNFGLETAPGTYTVVATNPSTSCTSNMSGTDTITVNPLPAKDTVTGGGNYCSGGSGVQVSLSNTTTGINYQLFNGSITVGSPVAGSGTSYDFGPQIAAGAYTVVATNPITGCTNTMYGNGVVVIDPLPGSYYVAGGGSHCPGSAGVHVLLNGSDIGINYQLLLGGGNVGSPVAGTGVFLDFGAQSAAGVYTVLATNMLTGCTAAMTGSTAVSISAIPTIELVTGGGNYCPAGTGVSVSLSGSTAGVNYQLFHDGSITGSPVAGTGAALDFGLQTATGAYTAVATDTGTTCSANMSGSVNVGTYPLPLTYLVSGGGSFCPGGAGVDVIMSGSETGVNYQLFDGGIPEGSPVAGTGSGLDFGAQTATGNYIVVATNTSTTCTNTMTHNAVVTNYPQPNAYAVTGGGNYCVGGAGVSVSLAGSDIGINYQLYDNSAPVGGLIAGNGSMLNFGTQTAAGNYVVVATNGTTGCTSNMTDTVAITINALPAIHSVSGSATTYCAGGAGIDVFISSSDAGVNYQLYRGPVMIGVPVTGTGSAIDFGLQTISGTYTVKAIDAASGCTSNMAGGAPVSTTPLPTVNNVIGGGSYCAGGSGVHIGVDGSMPGVTYQLSNGSITGAPVAGTGAALDLGAQTLAGSYIVTATNTLSGCSTDMNGSATVVVNPLPGVFSVTGGGSYCAGGTGVNIGLSGSGPVDITYQLMRGGSFVSAPVTATGGEINFGTQTIAGNYTVVATNSSTSCTVNMASSANVTINSLPSVYTLTGGGSYCVGGTGVNVGLSGSNSGIAYQLSRGGTILGAPVDGTGGILNFGLQTVAGAYMVTATNSATTCTSSMASAATVVINPLPVVFNVIGGGNYCPGTPGVHVGLDGSTTGILYHLSLAGTTVSGTGSPVDFGLQTAGTYTVSATNTATGCTNNMAGSTVVSLGTSVTPSVSISTGVGDTVCSGTITTFSALAANGGALPVYQWSVNSVSAGFGSTYTYTPSNGDNVSVTLTSNATCATPASVTSSFVINVVSSALPSVSVTTSPGSVVCQGTVVNYAANPEYGGTAPSFTWLKNGVSVAAGATYSYAPADSDIVYCQMTSNYPCRLANIVSSNNVLMLVDQPIIPVVTITASPSAHVSVGDQVTLTATVDHGGPAPTYQWFVNGIPVPGAASPTLTSSNFSNGDSVTCQVTSSGVCSGLVGFNSVQIFTNVGVNQVTNSGSDIVLIPNPNKGVFTVKGTLGTITDEAAYLEVYDLLGQIIYKNTVMTHNGSINEQVQLNNTPANGMYILNLRSASQNNIFHFVIEQ